MTARAWIDDPFSVAIRSGRGPLWLQGSDGRRFPLDVERWCAPPDRADHSLLRRCLRPRRAVLDVGCGPGRLVAELLALGVPALGVDLTPAAVARTTGLGGAALRRSVFDRLPGEGRWGTVLLADGNIGIGGDPGLLLRRIRQLLAPGGLLLAEVEPGDSGLDERLTVRIEGPDRRLGPPFDWARVDAGAAVGHGTAAGLTETERWTHQGRHFIALQRPAA